WAVTAPPELSPADGDGPSPAWTVHPPESVAPFAPGPGSSLASPAPHSARPGYQGLDASSIPRSSRPTPDWRWTLQKKPAPAPAACGGRRSPFSITRSNLAFQVTSPGLPIRFRQRLQDSFTARYATSNLSAMALSPFASILATALRHRLCRNACRSSR